MNPQSSQSRFQHEPKWLPKLVPKRSEETKWQNNNKARERNIKMQGGKTSKILIPCMRRAHLNKTASFKNILEQIQTKHKSDAKIQSKQIENQF